MSEGNNINHPEHDRGNGLNFDSQAIEIGEKLFQLRDYTPIPLILLALFFAEPTPFSACLGTLVVVAGELFRIYAVAFIGTISRTRNTSTVGKRLITEGPFAMMRNPLYVGNFFICVGLAILTSVVWFTALTVILFGFQYYCIVKYEEKLLVESFGDEYRTYMQTVPAWIPKNIPSLEDWAWPIEFSSSLRSEKRTLTAIAVLLLAIVLIGSI